jgi:hypothetical protein
MSSQRLTRSQSHRFSSFKDNVDAYIKNREMYKQRYPEEFVIVYKGEVIDHDQDLKRLLDKLKKMEIDHGLCLIDRLSEAEENVSH